MTQGIQVGFLLMSTEQRIEVFSILRTQLIKK